MSPRFFRRRSERSQRLDRARADRRSNHVAHKSADDTKRSTASDKGFTLLELIVNIATIGILVAIAVPMFNTYRRRGYDADVKTNIGNAIISQEAYFTHNETYTSSLTDLKSWGFKQGADISISVTGTATAFTITGAAVRCSSSTGVWSFASSSGTITGVACN